MSVAATIFWVLTAGVGTFMVTISGGVTAGSRATPPSTLLSSVAGLQSSRNGCRRSGPLGGLPDDGCFCPGVDRSCRRGPGRGVGVALGAALGRRWAARDERERRLRRRSTPAEQHIQRLPVVLHGTFAGVTLVLVLLVALKGRRRRRVCTSGDLCLQAGTRSC